MKKISFAGPHIAENAVEHATDAVRNGWYETFDKHTRKLEKTVCDIVGAKYGIATHCCTQALHLASASLGLKAGDEVIVPDHSWIATAYSVTYTGATCVFVDIDPVTLCVDPKAIKKAITPKTKAIMLVHNFGIPAEMDEIVEIARNANIKIIEDAAPALGSLYKGKSVGTLGDVGCFSFQGAKLTVSSEGGILVTNDERIYERAALLSNMGRTDRLMPFWSDEIGYQYTMGNIAASVALAQVETLDTLVEMKRTIFNWYKTRLEKHPKIRLVQEREYMRSNYCYPSIFLSHDIRTPRDEILAEFRKRNIHCRPGFPRMNQNPVYAHDIRFDNAVAEEFEKHGLVLSSALNLNENDIDFVCRSLFELID